MAGIKCKMCGADLFVKQGQTYAECEYCGSRQTIPSQNSEKIILLFDRANRLRTAYQFDKAADIYEKIAVEFPNEAESHWGIVLCKYGIVYVTDPKTGRKMPTCHRTIPGTILEDPDYLAALSKSDEISSEIYRQEAEQIDQIQKKILSVVAKEEPYDVFLCYKETEDATGERTDDSWDAQDIYTELVGEGYRVFFSRITLKRRAGSEYEPYIYAALSSAKVMLVIGSRYEHLDAVWVKNEWGRFLEMMRQQPGKTLIPCYRNMDSYDLPKELRNLHGLNMADMLFSTTLKKRLERVIAKKNSYTQELTDMPNVSLENLAKRAQMFLESHDWEKAAKYASDILAQDPQWIQAYLIRLMAKAQVTKKQDLAQVPMELEKDPDFDAYVRGAASVQKEQMREFAREASRNFLYTTAMDLAGKDTPEDIHRAAMFLQQLSGWKDADIQRQRLEEREKEMIYLKAYSNGRSSKTEDLRSAIELFASISGWKDADAQKEKVIVQYNDRVYQQATELKNHQETETNGGTSYKTRLGIMEGTVNRLEQAMDLFGSIHPWKDTQQQIKSCEDMRKNRIYREAQWLFDKGYPTELLEAVKLFHRISGYKDAARMKERSKTKFREYYANEVKSVKRWIKMLVGGNLSVLILAAMVAVGYFLMMRKTGFGYDTLATFLMSLPVICLYNYSDNKIYVDKKGIGFIWIWGAVFIAVLAMLLSTFVWGFLDMLCEYISLFTVLYSFLEKVVLWISLGSLVGCAICQLFSLGRIGLLRKMQEEKQKEMEKAYEVLVRVMESLE